MGCPLVIKHRTFIFVGKTIEPLGGTLGSWPSLNSACLMGETSLESLRSYHETVLKGCGQDVPI